MCVPNVWPWYKPEGRDGWRARGLNLWYLWTSPVQVTLRCGRLALTHRPAEPLSLCCRYHGHAERRWRAGESEPAERRIFCGVAFRARPRLIWTLVCPRYGSSFCAWGGDEFTSCADGMQLCVTQRGGIRRRRKLDWCLVNRVWGPSLSELKLFLFFLNTCFLVILSHCRCWIYVTKGGYRKMFRCFYIAHFFRKESFKLWHIVPTSLF